MRLRVKQQRGAQIAAVEFPDDRYHERHVALSHLRRGSPHHLHIGDHEGTLWFGWIAGRDDALHIRRDVGSHLDVVQRAAEFPDVFQGNPVPGEHQVRVEDDFAEGLADRLRGERSKCLGKKDQLLSALFPSQGVDGHELRVVRTPGVPVREPRQVDDGLDFLLGNESVSAAVSAMHQQVDQESQASGRSVVHLLIKPPAGAFLVGAGPHRAGKLRAWKRGPERGEDGLHHELVPLVPRAAADQFNDGVAACPGPASPAKIAQRLSPFQFLFEGEGGLVDQLQGRRGGEPARDAEDLPCPASRGLVKLVRRGQQALGCADSLPAKAQIAALHFLPRDHVFDGAAGLIDDPLARLDQSRAELAVAAGKKAGSHSIQARAESSHLSRHGLGHAEIASRHLVGHVAGKLFQGVAPHAVRGNQRLENDGGHVGRGFLFVAWPHRPDDALRLEPFNRLAVSIQPLRDDIHIVIEVDDMLERGLPQRAVPALVETRLGFEDDSNRKGKAGRHL